MGSQKKNWREAEFSLSAGDVIQARDDDGWDLGDRSGVGEK